ncbi:MAG: tripeptidase T [Candidatus Caldatribacteriota bacterium]
MVQVERMIRNLCEMVQISSESGEEKEFLEFLYKKFTDELKAKCQFDDYGNLIAKIQAKSCNLNNISPLFFAMHADTVKPGKGIKPKIQDGFVISSGDTILGADCKAGIAEFIEAIQSASNFPPLELVITREEEVGFRGVKNLDFNLISAKQGFLLDMDVLDKIVIGGPSHMFVDIEIIGKSAHAGMEPEKGISAIQTAAKAIAIIKDGRIDPETTSNIGIIQGGIIRNGVPEKVVINAEVRSLNHKKCLLISQIMKELFEVTAKTTGAKAEVILNLAYKAHRIPDDSPMIKIAKEALENVGIKAQTITITGGLESAIYNEKGIETIPLGNGVQNEHSTSEKVAISDMETVVKVLHYIFNYFCIS